MTACIRRTFFGGQDEQTFVEFAYSTIQDGEVAIEVAETMLSNGLAYEWNADEPEFYEEFEVISADELRAQVNAYRKENEL